jgi:hypothetical protein
MILTEENSGLNHNQLQAGYPKLSSSYFCKAAQKGDITLYPYPSEFTVRRHVFIKQYIKGAPGKKLLNKQRNKQKTSKYLQKEKTIALQVRIM